MCSQQPNYEISDKELEAVNRVEQGETVLLALQHPNNNFTMVPNLMLDTRSPYKVSEDAVGYWVSISLKALNPSWQFNIKGYVKTCSAGERVVRKNLDDLEAHGWLLRMRRRMNGGAWAKGAFWFVLSDPTQYLSVTKTYEDMGYVRANTFFEDNLEKLQVNPNTAKCSVDSDLRKCISESPANPQFTKPQVKANSTFRRTGADLGKCELENPKIEANTKPQVKANSTFRRTAKLSTIKEFNKYNNLSTSEVNVLVEHAPTDVGAGAGNNSQSYSRAFCPNSSKNEIQNNSQQRESAAAKSAAAPRGESEAETKILSEENNAKPIGSAGIEAKPLDRDDTSSLESELKNISERPSGETEEPSPSEAYMALEKSALRKAKPESRTKAIEAYSKLLAKGYSEDEIRLAYEHFIDRMEKQHGQGNTFYVMTLLSWLTKNTGFKTDLAALKQVEKEAQEEANTKLFKRAKRWWDETAPCGEKQAELMIAFARQVQTQSLNDLAEQIINEPAKVYADGYVDTRLWEKPSFGKLFAKIQSKDNKQNFIVWAYKHHLEESRIEPASVS